MAFNAANFSRVSLAYNTGAITTDSGVLNGPAMYTYRSTTDNVAAIAGANYFADVVYQLSVKDYIFITGSDANNILVVDTIDRDAGTITTVSFTTAGVVGTANIQDGAVTTTKIADGDVTTAKLDDDAVTSAKLDPQVLQYAVVNLSAANILAMYGAPVQVLAAGGANTLHLVEHAVLMMDYNSIAYAAGGVIGLQYGNTANLAGELATATIPAANIQGAADTADMVAGALTSGALTAVENQGLFISNQTAAFTTGNSPFQLHLWYRTIPSV